jgi:hypothetical protein
MRSKLDPRGTGKHVTTETAEFLSEQRQAIVQAAGAALARAHVRHYESAGPEEVTRRLDALYDHLLSTLATHDVGAMIGYAVEVAEERFDARYDLEEVQAAFNALEEAIWARALAQIEPSKLAETLGLVTTILGTGKDALARKYVSLAAGAHAPSLDLRSLFAGTDGVSADDRQP